MTQIDISGNSLFTFDAGASPSLENLDCGAQSANLSSFGENFSLEEYLSSASAMKSASVSVMKSAAVFRSASTYENIKDLKAFDASGNEIAAEIDSATVVMFSPQHQQK